MICLTSGSFIRYQTQRYQKMRQGTGGGYVASFSNFPSFIESHPMDFTHGKYLNYLFIISRMIQNNNIPLLITYFSVLIKKLLN